MNDALKNAARPFTSFFDEMDDKMRARQRQREADALRRTMAPEARVLELQEHVTRGRLAGKFLESDFWLDLAEPYLRKEAVVRPAVLREGDPAVDKRVYAEFLINSGGVKALAKFRAQIEEWVRLGAAAQQILEAEMKKRERERELRA